MEKVKLFIGLDMGKSSFTSALVHEPDPDKYHQEQFSNDKSGYVKLLSWVNSLRTEKNNELLFCLEHTGLYSLGLCEFFSQHGINYTLVSGLVLKRSLGIRRGKSDKADARDIARYAMLHKKELKQSVLPEKIIQELKEKLGERERMIKAKNSLVVPIKERNSVKKQKQASTQTTRIVREMTLAIKDLDKEILELINSDEKTRKCYKLLCSIPGIGPQIAARLVVITRCFTCFENSRKLACYAGIAPFEYTSGSSIKGRTKISQLADKSLKSLLSLAALTAVRFDRELRRYYLRKKMEGKHTRVILNAVKNKIIARAFAVIKRGTPYVEMATFAK
jgi:transposase